MSVFSKIFVAASVSVLSTAAFAQSANGIFANGVSIFKIKTSPLCPVGAVCVTGGTRVELSLNVGCPYSLGNISSRTFKDSNGEDKLAVSVVGVSISDPRAAFCATVALPPVIETLSFPNAYFTENDVLDLNAK